MLNLLKKPALILMAAGALIACSKKQESAAPPPAPAPEAAAAKTEAPAPAESYVGQWTGNSGEDLPVSFTVEGNQVISFSGSYSGKNGSCNFSGTVSSSDAVNLQGKTFNTHGKSSQEALEFTAQGTFTGPQEATGTLVWKGKSELCGDIDLKYQWTAKKNPPEAVDTE